MGIIISGITCIATIFFMVVLIALSKRKSLDNQIEKSLSQIQYLLVLALPIGVLTIVCKYFTINPLICTILWIATIIIIDRLITKTIYWNTSTDTKVALSFLSMSLCAFYFLFQAIVGFSKEYFGMFCVAGAIIIGYYVPIDVILSDDYMKKKWLNIVDGIKLSYLERTTKKIYWVVIFFFIVELIFDKSKYAEIVGKSVAIGFGIGIFASLVIISFVVKNNSIKDCTDSRKPAFDSLAFAQYKNLVEDKLGLSHQELYDHVESYLFYKAFESDDKNYCMVSEKVERKIYEVIQEQFSLYAEYKVYPKENGHNYVLKSGQKEYVHHCFVDSWSIFCLYMTRISGIPFENGGIPQKSISKYMDWGFCTEEEHWLLFFLENYHLLKKHKRKKYVPNELRNFLFYVYREQALWILPKRCIQYLSDNKNMDELNNLSSGNIILDIVFGWFEINRENGDTKGYLVGKVEKERYANAFESWLMEYADWEIFVKSNKLTKMVEKKPSLKSYGLCKPKKIFSMNLSGEDTKKERKKWLKAFKKTTDLFFYRY